MSMLIDVAEKPAELQIKTTDHGINILVTAICFIGITSLVFFLVGRPDAIASFVILIGSGIASYFAARFFTLSYTTFTFGENRLDVVDETQLLSFFRNRAIDTTQVIGYEILRGKDSEILAIYLNNKSPYVFSLVDTPRYVVEAFFEHRLRVINKSNRLSDNSFKKTFFSSMKLLSAILLAQLCLLGVYEYSYYIKHEYYFSLNPYHGIRLLLINFFVALFYAKYFYKLKVRIAGKYFSAFMIWVNFGLLIGGMAAWENYSYRKHDVEEPREVFNNLKAKFIEIEDKLRIDLGEIGFETKVNDQRKGTMSTFKQFLTAPAEVFPGARPLLWVGYEFEGGKFNKSLSYIKREQLFNEAFIKNRQSFQTTMAKKIHFYEVVYSGFNPHLNKMNF